ncbi:MAG: DUF2332 family protein [Elusimicrobia bacterium]|nr:DUF2332 family protein [Elusimicrobiota bacterium]
MERLDFRERVAKLLAYTADKAPQTAGMLRALEADLAKETGWFGRLAAAWKGRAFGPSYEAPLLLLAALHREALAGRAPALAKTFPSCGGTEKGAGPAALAFLDKASASFFEALAGESLQTNEPARSAAWLLPACAAFLTRNLPFHLVELGTSAGLVLVGDYLPRSTKLALAGGDDAEEPPRWRDSPYPVLSRHGLDRRPRRVSKPEDVLWLKGCVWPHDLERLGRLEKAAALFAALEKEPSGPRLREASFAEMPAWIQANLKPHPEEGLLVLNAQAADFLSAAEYEALKDGLGAALKSWGERGLWIELELPRGSDGEHELRAHRWIGPRFESRLLGRADSHAKTLRVEPGWDFLRPLGPVTGPRITREEPPKQLQPGLYRFPGGNS